ERVGCGVGALPDTFADGGDRRERNEEIETATARKLMEIDCSRDFRLQDVTHTLRRQPADQSVVEHTGRVNDPAKRPVFRVQSRQKITKRLRIGDVERARFDRIAGGTESINI